MKCKIIDPKYHFITLFDDETRAYIRSGIIKKDRDTGEDPFMASFPHLIDVGVTGHCIHGKTGLCRKAGIGCCQNGAVTEKPNMTIDDFRWIAAQCRGRTNQFALGGRGDPEQYTESVRDNLSERHDERKMQKWLKKKLLTKNFPRKSSLS